MKIGVLSFQGSFVEHLNSIKALGHTPIAVKTAEQLNQCKALILPGGETTNLRKVIPFSLKKEIMSKAKKGFPIYGTCAGAILLAEKIEDEISFLPLIEVEIQRNAYGSQLDSFEEKIEINAEGFSNKEKKFPAVFIRAPQIKKIFSKKVKVLAYCNKKPVLLRQKNILISTFHPELTNDLRIHEFFLKMISD
ncbi:MAG: pyridoxal 5'-phosphate synthase glutaminase subunit PdxT [Candidatus Diapherotrites archaeon]|nr:pyridoxal 5'-phosphate synthase glutaminase subunit PdxT [Candidatus Diapherotrites archaeon]